MSDQVSDLLVIGAGPAGCAAAVLAASLNLNVVVVDRTDRPGGTLWRIPTIDNVLGGFRTGPDLARTLETDLRRLNLSTQQGDVAAVRTEDSVVCAETVDGRYERAHHAVIACGVGPTRPEDANWVTTVAPTWLPALSRADTDGATGQTWLVVGADRPLGTFLRANPDLDVRLLVAYPPADAYKTDEVATDPRVTLHPVDHLTFNATGATDDNALQADRAFANIGVTPPSIEGLPRDDDGYYPPGLQHPRIHIAGDLRSAQNQRIQIAMGSGAEAALAAYRALRV